MEINSAFSNDDRNRIQALKSQLKWKCTNIHQGSKFRLVINPYKRTHTIYFPKDTDYNPSLYNYLLELTRAFYTEKYGEVFGDVYFDPETDRNKIDLYSSIVSTAQHWFTSHFCQVNFADIWTESLKVKYEAINKNPENITKSNHETLNAALICAQLALVEKKSTSTIIAGSMKNLVNIFVNIDPAKVDIAPVAILVNNIIEMYENGQTLQFNKQQQGGFWKPLL